MSNLAILTSNENGANSLTDINANFLALNTDKAEKASPTFTGTVVLPATTSIGTVSSTEIGYVDGVTSAIQTQLDAKSPLASPTFTGTVVLPTVTAGGVITLNENTSVALDPAGSADGKYSGVTVTGTGGATIAFGDLLSLDVSTSRWKLADVSVAAAAAGDARKMLGMAVTSSTDGGALTVLLHGIIRADANFPTFTIGNPVYATTTGDVTSTQPTTTDYVIRIVGHALTGDEIHFNPDGVWTTHT